jgi:N-acetylglucosaminyldiphosphoundecaprenol N-acetyl-beta-D-mannosaminyltransferase
MDEHTHRISPISLMGVAIDPLTPNELIERVCRASLAGEGGYVVTPNLDVLRLVSKSPGTADLVAHASLRVADGMPLLWASRVQGTPLPARVAGSDLIFSLTTALAERKRSLFLLGGDPGTAAKAAERLSELNPDLRIAGSHCPIVGFADDPRQVAEVLDAVRRTNPDFVYIGLPFGVAAALCRRITDESPTTWAMGVGISFSFVTGDVSRAPVWVQRCGLEWLHRLMQEPGRLFHRYVVQDLPFLAKLLASAVWARHRMHQL